MERSNRQIAPVIEVREVSILGPIKVRETVVKKVFVPKHLRYKNINTTRLPIISEGVVKRSLVIGE